MPFVSLLFYENVHLFPLHLRYESYGRSSNPSWPTISFFSLLIVISSVLLMHVNTTSKLWDMCLLLQIALALDFLFPECCLLLHNVPSYVCCIFTACRLSSYCRRCCLLLLYFIKTFQDVSCEYDEFRVNTDIYKLTYNILCG